MVLRVWPHKLWAVRHCFQLLLGCVVPSGAAAACAQASKPLSSSAESLQQRVLVARAAWLVGVCGGELPPPLWGEALACLVRHMGSPDLVLALSAVSALLALLSTFIEQQHVSLPHPLLTNLGKGRILGWLGIVP